MMNEIDDRMGMDREKIRNAIRLQLPIEITSYAVPRNMEVYIQRVLELFLAECHQEHLQNSLSFCLGELLANAKKANTKRVYFEEKGLDINDPQQYETGMKDFRTETFDNINYYLELQRKAGLYVKFVLQLKEDKIYIEIRNNCLLTEMEKGRIAGKLDSVQQYKSMEEVLGTVLDQTEGAGLGIIIVILMLQKAGIPKENYQVFTEDDETVTRIILPGNESIFAAVEIMSYELAYMIDRIAVVRNHFDVINALVSSQELDRKAIRQIVNADIGLALLAQKYALEKDPEAIGIKHCLSLISDDELRYIYSDSNPSVRVIENTPSLENLFFHAQRTAYFTYNLFKKYGEGQSKPDTLNADVMYSLGLFNSIGFALIETQTQEQRNYMQELSCQYDEDSKRIMDVFNFGASVNYIKRTYTKKIKLPEYATMIISSWNTKRDKLPEPLVFAADILYLAEMMQYYDEKRADFCQIDRGILKKYGITHEKQFKTTITQMKISLDSD